MQHNAFPLSLGGGGNLCAFSNQRKEWPTFSWDYQRLVTLLSTVRYKQGRLLGKMEGIAFRLQEEATLQTITEDVVKSSEIEGEKLNPEQVRSSIARRLGMDVAGLVLIDRNVEGVVEMMLDATKIIKRFCRTNAFLTGTLRFFQPVEAGCTR